MSKQSRLAPANYFHMGRGSTDAKIAALRTELMGLIAANSPPFSDVNPLIRNVDGGFNATLRASAETDLTLPPGTNRMNGVVIGGCSFDCLNNGDGPVNLFIYGIVSQVSFDDTGFYDIKFGNSQPDANYLVSCTCGLNPDNGFGVFGVVPLSGKSTDGFTLKVYDVRTQGLTFSENNMVVITRMN